MTEKSSSNSSAADNNFDTLITFTPVSFGLAAAITAGGGLLHALPQEEEKEALESVQQACRSQAAYAPLACLVEKGYEKTREFLEPR